MNHKEHAPRSESSDPSHFHGTIGWGHIPTLLVAIGLWWLILSALPIGQ